jgi:selenocysteine lyase/cysteine desulfurase
MTKGSMSNRRQFLSGLAVGGAAAATWPGVEVGLLAREAISSSQAPAGPPRVPAFAEGEGEPFWAGVRAHFTLDPQLTFLNNGTLGPSPDVVLDTRDYYARLMAKDPTDGFRSKELADVRAQLAAFINAAPDETSITHSTTEGMNIFAHGLDWRAGDEVVFCDQEHFGAVEPYRTLAARYGVKIVTVKLPVPATSVSEIVEAYARVFTPRTRVLMVSHVSWLTGLVAPLRELADLAHAHGALISVDGAQSFGVLPVDVQALGLDHFAGSGQKWLLAGTGTGINYVRRDVHPKVWPLYGFDNPEQHAAARYERSGQLGVPAATGMGAAMQFQLAIGKSRIEARARELGRRVRDGVMKIRGATLLSSTDPTLAANLQVFTLAPLPSPGIVRLMEQRERIVLRNITYLDTKAVRISTHFYNTPEQVDRVVGLLASWAETPPQFPPEPQRR